MSGVMSDADFLGASPSGTAPSKTMSDEEFFGTPHQPTPFERLKTGAEELAKKAVPMVQKGARQLVSNAATVLDIPASIGGQMAGIAGGAYGDIKSALEGGTAEQNLAAGQAVKEATSAAVPQGGFKMMLQQALGEHLGKNAVEDVMGKIGGVVDQAGALVDKAVGVKGVGGQIIDPLTLAGMKFTKDAVTGKVTPAPKWQGMDKITPEIPHDLPTMTPEDVVKAQTVGPQATAAEHINQLNGILDPKEQRARSKQMSADAKAVFADKQNWVKDPETGEQVFQPQYTSYLEGQMHESVTNAEYLKAERSRQEAAQRETAVKHQEAWEKSGGQAARVWPEDMSPEDKMRQMMEDLHAREAAEQNPHTPGQSGGGIGNKNTNTLSSRNMNIIKAGLGSGAVAVYLAASPEEQKEMAEGAGILGAVLATRSHGDGVASALGPLLNKSRYTMKSFERLPMNQTEFPKQMIQQELARADIGKAERETVQKILDDTPGDSITANILVGGLKLATGSHTLTLKAYEKYGDYGLENIGRNARADWASKRNEGTQNALSIVWQLPEHMEMSDKNHFQDPRYFGHTRGFDEGDVHHVVEVQSDLIQHTKPVSEEESAKLLQEYQQRTTESKELEATIKQRGFPSGDEERTLRGLHLRLSELHSKIDNAGTRTQLREMIPRWPRRLIREELGRAAEKGKPVVRFATADTVAKVEGWPESAAGKSQFKPEHQSIYDRYQKDIAKYLRSLGGKDYTDPHGHTWIEVPTPKHPRVQMYGRADIQQLAAVAGGVAGALYGATQDRDNLLEGAALGGLAGVVGGSLTARFGPAATTAFGDATRLALGGKPWEAAKGLLPGPISAAFAEDTRVRIKPQMNAWEIAEKRDALARSHMVLTTVTAVPDKARREAISHALEGQAVPLTPVERGVAQKIQSYLAGLGARGMDAGVIKELVSDYVTHIYGKDAVPVIQDWLKTRTLGATTSVYGKTRVGPPTLAEVNKLMRDKGLPPIETDIASIMEQYGKSMSRAIAGKTLVDTLKARTVPRDYKGKTIETPLIMADVPGKTPGDYKGFGKQGLVAHPDIIPALKFAFENTNPLVHIRALEAVNTAVKRSAVSFSLFHAKSLLDGFVAATQMNGKQMAIGGVAGALYGLANNDDPITYALAAAGLAGYGPGLMHVAQAAAPKVFGMNKYVEALRDSKLAQTDPAMAKMIDMAIQGGLEFTLPGGEGAVKDVNKGFYEGAKWLQNAADAVIPGGGKAVEGMTKLNHAVDGFMWERLHTGMKLEVFSKTYEKLTINNAKAHAADPKGVPLLDETAIAERASSFTNDIFGGINWRRIAEECKTRFGRDLAQSVYSPQGQRGLRLAMFAPDWTIATTRAAMKMGGQLVGQEAGTGLKGLFKPSTVTDFHRQYVLRAALNYAMIGDGINYAFTGRHLWQEKDPTYINLGDGRKMQFNKHAMEPVHWLLHPGQQALGKLSQPIREGLNQALGTEYLAPHLDKRTGNVVAGPMMRESAGKHLLNTISPIGVSQATGGGAQAGLMSMLGVPIYGMTAEQKAQIKLEQQKHLAEMGK